MQNERCMLTYCLYFTRRSAQIRCVIFPHAGNTWESRASRAWARYFFVVLHVHTPTRDPSIYISLAYADLTGEIS